MNQGPTPELDDIDKAIIRHLQVDGRMPYSRLGPAVDEPCLLQTIETDGHATGSHQLQVC